jgi:hypothetical protein
MNTPLRFTLCQVLLCYVRLSNGHQLLAEIHQSNGVMGRVQAVIPNTPEAEQMILMMNKNFPAYIGNILRDQGLPDSFLMDLFRELCCPTVISKMSLCTWDPDSSVLTTLREFADNQNLADLERAAWYKNAFDDLSPAKQGGPKFPAPPPESLFNLDKDCSIKTIHLHNDNRLPSAGGTPPPQKKSNTEVVKLANSDEDSASSSIDEGLRSAATNADEYAPSSSAEDNSQAPAATDGG